MLTTTGDLDPAGPFTAHCSLKIEERGLLLLFTADYARIWLLIYYFIR